MTSSLTKTDLARPLAKLDSVDPSQSIDQEAFEGIDEQGTQEQVDTRQQPPDIEEGGFDEEFDQPAEGKQKWTSQDGYAPKGSK